MLSLPHAAPGDTAPSWGGTAALYGLASGAGRLMNERLAPAEHAGLLLVVVGLIVLCAG